MPDGAAHLYDGLEQNNATSRNWNTLDAGLNIYVSNGRNVKMTSGEIWRATSARVVRMQIPAVAIDQLLDPSVTTYLYLTKTGALVISNTTGWDDIEGPFFPLAEATPGASSFPPNPPNTPIVDRRPRATLYEGLPGAEDRVTQIGSYLAQQPRGADTTASGFTVDTLYSDVAVGDAGATARLGLYAEGATPGTPGALVEDLGSVPVAAAGVQSAAVTPIELRPGRHWLALTISSAVPALRAYAHAPSGYVPLGLDPTDLRAGFTGWVATATGAEPPASPLPSTFPAAGLIAIETPLLALRRSA